MIKIRIKKTIKTLQREQEELSHGIELLIKENNIVISHAKTMHDVCRVDNYNRSVPIKIIKIKR